MAIFEHARPHIVPKWPVSTLTQLKIWRDFMRYIWTHATPIKVVASLGLAALIGACDAETEPDSSNTDTQLDVVEEAPAPDVIFDEMELLESGLYIQVLQTGSGPGAGHGDEMEVHYTVWLPNGSKLDSSYDHSPPDPLPMVLGITGLIDGWVEGVTGMRVGERRKLVLPYDLAYGAAGRPGGVPPYTPLTFIVELAEHIPAGEG